jgi:hypothetical protein
MTIRRETCRCAHEKHTHYEDRATGRRHACLAAFCLCIEYERDDMPDVVRINRQVEDT